MYRRVSDVLRHARNLLYNPMYLAQAEQCGTKHRLFYAVYDAAEGDVSLIIGALQAIQPLMTPQVFTVQDELVVLDTAEQVSKARELAAMSTVGPVSPRGSNDETLAAYQDAIAGVNQGQRRGNTE